MNNVMMVTVVKFMYMPSCLGRSSHPTGTLAKLNLCVHTLLVPFRTSFDMDFKDSFDPFTATNPLAKYRGLCLLSTRACTLYVGPLELCCPERRMREGKKVANIACDWWNLVRRYAGVA